MAIRTFDDVFEVLKATHQDFEVAKDFGFAFYVDPSNGKDVFAVTNEGEDEWTFDSLNELYAFLQGMNFGSWMTK